MAASVVCDRCGAEVDPRGLAGHQKSYACRAAYIRRQYAAQGYVVFNKLSPNSRYFVEGLFKRDITGYYSYYYNKRFTYGYYGPAWLYPVWQLAKLIRLFDRQVAFEMYQEAVRLGKPGPLFKQLNAERGFLERVANSDLKPSHKKHVLRTLLMHDLITAKAAFELLCASS